MAKKILIVEDEEDILYFAKIRLKDADYEVMTANSAESAAELMVKHKPDLILLDLLLPGARGEEFCRKLKADEKFKNIPVILFTATAHRVADKIKETGAEDGIMKPFDPNVLLKKIKRFL